jgi:hypothetical protein
MPNYAFPFPDLGAAEKELSYDYCYEKIPPEDRERIIRAAWERGADAARNSFEQHRGEGDFFVIAQENGLECRFVDQDYIVGNRRYFSDYLSGKKLIRLFTRSIAFWAEKNNLDEKTAANLILSHEFFHFLECNGLGLTSRMYQVPMIVIGPLKIGRTGIRALSEIGAHGFARTYYDLLREKDGPEETQGSTEKHNGEIQ